MRSASFRGFQACAACVAYWDVGRYLLLERLLTWLRVHYWVDQMV